MLCSICRHPFCSVSQDLGCHTVCLPSGSWIDAVKVELESAGDSGGFGQPRKVIAYQE